MPIPVITDHFLVQLVMRTTTDPTLNSFVNTFFFRNDTALSTPDQMADKVKTVLDAYLTGVNPPGTAALQTFLSVFINPALTEYRVYDLGAPAPRLPYIRDSSHASVGTNGLPNEVAAVLSYRSGPGTAGSGGTTNKRARGRIYFGPLSVSAVDITGSLPDARLTTGLRNALAGGALNIKGTSQDVTWRQYSRVSNVMADVSGGFVGNAPDTQRRRGREETARTVW